jgi:methionyl-tRNA formyltransferase
MQKSVIFFGNERLASGCTTSLPVLTLLKETGINIDLIIVNQKGSRSRNSKELEIEKFAIENNIELFVPKSIQDLKEKISQHQTELAILAAYGKIIPQEIIDLFPKGILNLHPSLLPKYRGPTPIESAILNGDEETGVSIMALSAGMDSGPIFKQVKLKLNGQESKQELADQLGSMGAIEITDLLCSAALPSPNQQTGDMIFCKLIEKSDSNLNLTKPASVLTKEIRAYLNWPSSKLSLELKDQSNLILTITKATFSSQKNHQYGPLSIKTSDGYLNIDKLKLPGRKEITQQEFLNGYRTKLQA